MLCLEERTATIFCEMMEHMAMFLGWNIALASAAPKIIVCFCIQFSQVLGVRYSTVGLAISANRLAIRPPAKAADGAREARLRCFVVEGVVLLSDLR